MLQVVQWWPFAVQDQIWCCLPAPWELVLSFLLDWLQGAVQNHDFKPKIGIKLLLWANPSNRSLLLPYLRFCLKHGDLAGQPLRTMIPGSLKLIGCWSSQSYGNQTFGWSPLLLVWLSCPHSVAPILIFLQQSYFQQCLPYRTQLLHLMKTHHCWSLRWLPKATLWILLWPVTTLGKRWFPPRPLLHRLRPHSTMWDFSSDS